MRSDVERLTVKDNNTDNYNNTSGLDIDQRKDLL